MRSGLKIWKWHPKNFYSKTYCVIFTIIITMTCYWVQMYFEIQVHSPLSEIQKDLKTGEKKNSNLSQVPWTAKPDLNWYEIYSLYLSHFVWIFIFCCRSINIFSYFLRFQRGFMVYGIIPVQNTSDQKVSVKGFGLYKTLVLITCFSINKLHKLGKHKPIIRFLTGLPLLGYGSLFGLYSRNCSVLFSSSIFSTFSTIVFWHKKQQWFNKWLINK